MSSTRVQTRIPNWITRTLQVSTEDLSLNTIMFDCVITAQHNTLASCLFVFLGVTTHCGCIFHSPVAGFSLLIFEVSRSNRTTRHIRQDSSGRVINPSQRPLPDKTQHSQQTNASGGIRNHNLRGQAAIDLRVRPLGHWDRHSGIIPVHIPIKTLFRMGPTPV